MNPGHYISTGIDGCLVVALLCFLFILDKLRGLITLGHKFDKWRAKRRQNVTAERHRCRWPGCESPRGVHTGQFCQRHFDKATNLNPPEWH